MLSVGLLLLVGFFLLIKGADWLVGGASLLAKRLGVSDLAIGLTVVAFGTSAPEFLVTVLASAQGKGELAVGNILGSNIANILLILGVAALIYPLQVTRNTVRKEIPFSALAAIGIFVLGADYFGGLGAPRFLSRWDGAIFLGCFSAFLVYMLRMGREDASGVSPEKDMYSVGGLAGLRIVSGITALCAGGYLVVQSAVSLAEALGVSQTLIGLTIVAVGTSLPELVTSAVAARQKNADIAVGNVVGSNIFNIFLILGFSALIRPVPYLATYTFDVGVTIAASVLLLGFMWSGRRMRVDRWEGAVFVFCYAAYLFYIVQRG